MPFRLDSAYRSWSSHSWQSSRHEQGKLDLLSESVHWCSDEIHRILLRSEWIHRVFASSQSRHHRSRRTDEISSQRPAADSLSDFGLHRCGEIPSSIRNEHRTKLTEQWLRWFDGSGSEQFQWARCWENIEGCIIHQETDSIVGWRTDLQHVCYQQSITRENREETKSDLSILCRESKPSVHYPIT